MKKLISIITFVIIVTMPLSVSGTQKENSRGGFFNNSNANEAPQNESKGFLFASSSPGGRPGNGSGIGQVDDAPLADSIPFLLLASADYALWIWNKNRKSVRKKKR